MNTLIPPEFPPRSQEDLYRLALRINRKWYQFKSDSTSFNPMDVEWDNLIILDAARPEFIEGNTDQDLKTVNLLSSSSGDFMNMFWNGNQYHDTVYVTANPHAETTLDSDVFHAVWSLLEEDWNSDSKTVLPETVVSRALEARKQYPNKRLIIHFMQPHFPFLGETGGEIDAGIASSLGESDIPNPWNEAMWGSLTSQDTLVKAYQENHKIAIEAAESLVQDLSGQSVITADHTNLIGERGIIPVRLFGHPIDFPHPNLTKVPWIEFDGESREVISEPPEKTTEVDSDIVSERLASLGYVD